MHESFPAEAPLTGCRLLSWHGRKILLITDRNFEVPHNLNIDCLIIANDAVEDILRLRRSMTCKKVILDSSNSFFFASRFLEAAKLHKLEVHSVLHQGAFISKIEKKDT